MIFIASFVFLCYNKNERISLIKYLFRLTEILGYKIEQPACSCCGEIIKGRVFFNFRNAEFSCEECREDGFNEIRPETYDAYVKIIGGVAPEIEQEQCYLSFCFIIFLQKPKCN